MPSRCPRRVPPGNDPRGFLQSDTAFFAALRTSGAFRRRLRVSCWPPDPPHGLARVRAGPAPVRTATGRQPAFPFPRYLTSLPRSALLLQPDRPDSEKRLFDPSRSVSPPLSGLVKPGAKPSGDADRRLSAGRNQSGTGEEFPAGALSAEACPFRRGGGRGTADMVGAGAAGYGSRGHGTGAGVAGCKRLCKGGTERLREAEWAPKRGCRRRAAASPRVRSPRAPVPADRAAFVPTAAERAHRAPPQTLWLPAGLPREAEEEGGPRGARAVPQGQEDDRAEGEAVP